MDIFGAFSDMNRADREFMLESLESLHNVKKHKENMENLKKWASFSDVYPSLFSQSERDEESKMDLEAWERTITEEEAKSYFIKD